MLPLSTGKQKQISRKTLIGKLLGLFFSPVKASCHMCDFALVCVMCVGFFIIVIPIVSKAVAETVNS